MKILQDNCTGCGLCEMECPCYAITIKESKAYSDSYKCVECGLCYKICNNEAIDMPTMLIGERTKCGHCPVHCNIVVGFMGACQRYENINGTIIRNKPLMVNQAKNILSKNNLPVYPLITGIGSGTTLLAHKPAPLIVQDNIEGVDVITAVSETPLSYSGIKVKIDTNKDMGKEGTLVKRSGRIVGRVDTEEYGSKMLSIGGVNLLHGKTGGMTAKTIVNIANKEWVELKTDKGKDTNGAEFLIKVGEAPIINGIESKKMRVGCGSATIALFAPYLKEVADETIVLDPQITGLLTQHESGQAMGLRWSGITPKGVLSTPGRYFGERGSGLGGTNIINPQDVIYSIENWVKQGTIILITDTSGDTCSMLKVIYGGLVEEIKTTRLAKQMASLIRKNCEPSLVNALYVAGFGGSARTGVVKNPIGLTKAVHKGDVKVTIGGVPTCLLPGGGITVLVDVLKVPVGAFSWTPTPATIAPVEYSMTRETYEKLDGHIDSIKELEQVLQERKIKWIEHC